MEQILTAIRQKSNSLPVTNNPELDDFGAYARIIQLWGMLELIRLLSDSDITIPAVIDGGIRAEIDRLRNQTQGGVL